MRELGERAGVSERFVQLETGDGNISVARLEDVAEALGTTAARLLTAASEQPRAAAPPPLPIVALLGLRGAGKSTIGAKLARKSVKLVNPTTGAELARRRPKASISARVSFARDTGGPALRAMSFKDRSAMLRKFSRAIHEKRDELMALGTGAAGNTRSDAVRRRRRVAHPRCLCRPRRGAR